MKDSQAALPMIRLQNIAILRGNHFILKDFSLDTGGGEIIWIRGANGSGKSTLLRAIAGLLPIATGHAQIIGSRALTDEAIALDPEQNLDAALRFWARLDGASGAQLEAALEAMDLVPLAELPVRLLSAGQRRRGALARMIASGAKIWLLDEPYNGLDQASIMRLDDALRRHAASGGIAMVASHIAPTINVARSLTLDHLADQSAGRSVSKVAA
jgi:heme exporter protein A